MEEIKDKDSIIAYLEKQVEQQSTTLKSVSSIVAAKEKEVAELKKLIQDLEENVTYKGLSRQLLENKKLEDINMILLEENQNLHNRCLKKNERIKEHLRTLDCYRQLCLDLSKLVPFYRFREMERLIDDAALFRH